MRTGSILDVLDVLVHVLVGHKGNLLQKLGLRHTSWFKRQRRTLLLLGLVELTDVGRETRPAWLDVFRFPFLGGFRLHYYCLAMLHEQSLIDVVQQGLRTPEFVEIPFCVMTTH